MKCKFRFFIVLFITILILNIAVTPYGVTANDEIQQIKQDIIDYNLSKNNVETLDKWVNNILSKDIGNAAEWYVIALSHQDFSNFSIYEKSLLDYLSSKKISSESTKLKFALTLIAIGSENEYIQNTLNNSMGKQGIMSLIYGLHIINNGYSHNEHTKEKVIGDILNMQLSDGGWALRGEVSDVDVTAMTIQALSPYYEDDNVKIQVDKAINLLSEKQLENGDYISYGVTNPESGAQVIVALSALGIDFINDQRFIKNGNNLLDGILQYRLQDGSFSHTINGTTNFNSTVQVYYSLVAYELFKENKGSLYNFDLSKDNENSSNIISEDSSFILSKDDNTSHSDSTVSQSEDVIEESTPINIKLIIVSILVILGIIILLVLYFKKKLNKNNILAVLLLFAILIVLSLTLDIQTKEQYYSNNNQSKENAIGTVTLSISCEELLNYKTDNSYIPEDGMILKKTEFKISKDETVYDILIEATRKNKIHIDKSGTDDSAYIEGINYLYEFN